MREEISIEVNAVIDEFGPQLYEDFDTVRSSLGNFPCIDSVYWIFCSSEFWFLRPLRPHRQVHLAYGAERVA